MELMTQIIGFLAAIIGTSLMLPQVFKTFKTKRVDDVSLVMLVLYFLNCLLWLIYGFLISAMPVTLCNSVALVISVIQLTLKFRYNNGT